MRLDLHFWGLVAVSEDTREFLNAFVGGTMIAIMGYAIAWLAFSQ